MFSFTWNLRYGIKITNTNGYSSINMRVNMTWAWIMHVETWVILCPISNIQNCVSRYPCNFIHRVVQERETEEKVNLKMVRIQITNTFKRCSTHTAHQKTKLGFEKIQNLSIERAMGNHTTTHTHIRTKCLDRWNNWGSKHPLFLAPIFSVFLSSIFFFCWTNAT